MKKSAIIGALLVCGLYLLTGCGGSETGSATTSTDTTETTTTTLTAPQSDGVAAQPVFSIAAVGLGPDGYVTLLNFTDQPQAMLGHTLCQGSACIDLPSVTIEPGGRARIAVGDGGGLSDVVLKEADIGELKTSDGEIAIYAEDDSSSRRLVSFMEWGSTPHAHTAEAIAKGLWLTGSYAPTADNATRLYKNPGGLWLFDTAG